MTDGSETAAHVEKETLVVDINIPEHAARVTTELFRKTRLALIAHHGDRCWICGLTAAETGHPTEAHHYPVERSLAEMFDWSRFMADARAGVWGPVVQAFDWDHFDPAHWESFVDDMTVNGMLLCKPHHIGLDEGIHGIM